jgi:hypothetical protein
MERLHRFRDAPSPACPALTQYTQKGVIPAKNVSKNYFQQFKRPSSTFFKIVCRIKNKKISNECFVFFVIDFHKNAHPKSFTEYKVNTVCQFRAY